MRFTCLLLASLLFALSTRAAELEKELLEKLMLPGITAKELDSAVRAARSAGLPSQTILEAKLMWGLRRQDTGYLSSIVAELDESALDFKAGDSPGGLDSVEHYRAMISYVRALIASDERDEDAFRRHITEAIWKFPQQGGIFSKAIEQFQTREKMSRVTLDFTLPLPLSKGSVTTLGKTIGSDKALLILFWSNGDENSLKEIPPFIQLGPSLAPYGIRLAAVNLDSIEVAEQAREKFGPPFPWLVEPAERPLTKLLEINSAPRAIIVSGQGRILFNGHPKDPILWKALKRISPTLVIPQM